MDLTEVFQVVGRSGFQELVESISIGLSYKEMLLDKCDLNLLFWYLFPFQLLETEPIGMPIIQIPYTPTNKGKS